MNWQLPGSGTPLQSAFWNSDEGMRALFQNMSDFYSNSGRNAGMASWLSSMFPASRSRYGVAAAQNPSLTWESWLQEQAPHLLSLFESQPASLRGSVPGFYRPGRQLW